MKIMQNRNILFRGLYSDSKPGISEEKAQCFGNIVRVSMMIQKKKKNKCQQNKEYKFIMETHIIESPKKKKQES